MDVVRINTAHQSPEGARILIRNIREVSDHVAVMIDTKGTEVRTTAAAGEIDLGKGDRVSFRGDPDRKSTREGVYVNHRGFVDEVPVGCSILIDDGGLEFLVLERRGDALIGEALTAGRIEGRKGVNVPGVSFRLPAVSQRDRDYIRLAAEQ